MGVSAGLTIAGLSDRTLLAQGATPVASPPAVTSEIDLAAVAPRGTDIPANLDPGFGGGYLPAELPFEASAEETAAVGLIRIYDGDFGGPGRPVGAVIRMYECAAADGVDALVAILSDIDRALASSPELFNVVELPPVDGAPTVAYSVEIDPSGLYLHGVSMLRAHDRFLFEVWIETFLDQSADPAQIEAMLATPAAATEEQLAGLEIVTELATTATKRLDQLMAGETPAGVDLAWPGQVLEVDSWMQEGEPRWQYYRHHRHTTFDSEALTALADEFVGGYSRTAVLGGAAEFGTPWVTASINIMASPAAVPELFEVIRADPQSFPTGGITPRGAGRTLVEDPVIDGADAALALTASINEGEPEDSASLVFAIAERVFVIDVQGMDSGETALQVAIDLASQQVTCGNDCGAPTKPEALA
jgi:hypothetical protein